METRRQEHLWGERQLRRARDPGYVANRRRVERIVARIEQLSRPSPRAHVAILNIGIGDARLERMLCDRGYDVHAVDPSSNIIAWVQQELGMDAAKARQGWAHDLPFPGDHFDIVVMSEVLEHLASDDMERALAQVLRVLKPGGHFLGTVPENEDLDLNRFKCAHCGAVSHRVGHEQTFTVGAMRDVLRRHFGTVHVKSFRGMYMNWRGVAYYQWIDLPFKLARIAKPGVRAPHQIVFNIFFDARKV